MPTRETPTHSPAPWVEDGCGNIVDAAGVVVAAVRPKDRRLVRQAPDLLAACREFVRDCESGGIVWGVRPHAEAMKALVDYIDGGGE